MPVAEFVVIVVNVGLKYRAIGDFVFFDHEMSASVAKFVDGFEIETDRILVVGHNLFDTVRQRKCALRFTWIENGFVSIAFD